MRVLGFSPDAGPPPNGSPENLTCDDCCQRMLNKDELREWKEDQNDD